MRISSTSMKGVRGGYGYAVRDADGDSRGLQNWRIVVRLVESPWVDCRPCDRGR